MNAGVFFCGEVVVDMLEHKHGSGVFNLLLGGSHFNSALGAARIVKRETLPFRIGFIGLVSRDMFGDRFYRALLDAGIDTSGVKRVPYNSTLAVVSVRPGEENEFSFYESQTTVAMTAPEDFADIDIKDSNKIFCFGSISTVLEPARYAWSGFAKNLKDASLIYYDLNTRPSIAKDPAKYRSLLQEWAGIAHVVRASEADIAWAYPGASFEEVASTWLNSGARIAVFTKGKNGAEAYTARIRAYAPSPALIAPHTIGAGDNANAGLVIALAKKDVFSADALEKLDEQDLSEVLAGANKAAAQHLVSIGAKPAAEDGANISPAL